MPLTYLPSPSWAVVYGEVPSATRWSELGLNDNSLATGAGIDDLAILTRHIAANAITGAKIANYKAYIQRDTTNTTENAAIIQAGWGRFNPAPNTPTAIENVTFPTPFTTLPIVLISPAGGVAANTNAPYPGTSTSYTDNQQAVANNQSTTGFSATLTRQGGATFSNATTIFYTWIAIGT